MHRRQRREKARGLPRAMALSVLVLAAPAIGQNAPLGPAPRTADGRFENFAGPIERPGPSVTLPFFARRVVGAFVERANPPKRLADGNVRLARHVGSDAPTATWVGHATLLVRLGGTTFLTDPIWSDTASPASFLGPRRHVAPGIAIDDLPSIDFVVISHNHYDHLDVDTVRRLAERRADTHFYVPLGNAEVLRAAGAERVTELDWGEHAEHGAVRVSCLPSQHWSQRGLDDRQQALWSSWAVTSDAGRFYFGGDTGAFAGFADIGAALGPFDLAALPIGAYEPVVMMQPFHMNPEEAVVAGLALRARRLVGMHYGTFDLTDEPLDEPPRRFRAAGAAAGYAEDALWVLDVGETRPF